MNRRPGGGWCAAMLALGACSANGPAEPPNLSAAAEPFVEQGTYILQIAERNMGRENVRFHEDGWAAEGWFELPGAPKTTYQAKRGRTEAGASRWEIGVDAGGEQVRIKATREGGVVQGSVSPADIACALALDDETPAIFFENLVWGCFVDLGRALVAKAASGELQPGFEVKAILTQAEQTFPLVLDEAAPVPQQIDDAIVALWAFELTGAGSQQMKMLTSPDGIPLSIAVPSQQLRVVMEGYEDLRMPGSEPITLVDRGAWRSQLSPAEHEVTAEEGVMIPMRDGVKLAADISRPADEGPHPAILIRTPYNRANEALTQGAFYARRGYALIAQDCRGRFDSEGDWYPLRNETEDGSDTIDWIAAQPWCDGKVGMIGGSYVGWVQWYAAKSGNPHLEAIVPQVSPPDPDQNIPYEGGVFLLSSGWWAKVLEHMEAGGAGLPDVDFESILATLPLSDLDEALGTAHPFLDDWASHPPTDAEYWDPVRYQPHLPNMDVAALHITGWYDGDQPGALQNFPIMRQQAKTARARQGQFLIVGPWGHGFNMVRKMGREDFGEEALVDLNSVYLRFFDRYLKGVENGMEDEDPVKVFVMGENRWHQEKGWPLPQTAYTKVYLDSGGSALKRDGDGRMSLEPSAGSPAFDDFRFDPSDVPDLDLDFNDVVGAQATADQSTNPDRDDDLEYVSPPLARDLEILGPIEVVAYVSTDALDTDVVASLFQRTPDGKMYSLAGGIQRVRYRNGEDEPVPPGEVVEVRVDCWATGRRIPKGHRLHLTVGSMAFPGYARNPGTLENPAAATELKVAHNRLWHDAARPSHLLLPVIPREDTGELAFEAPAAGAEDEQR